MGRREIRIMTISQSAPKSSIFYIVPTFVIVALICGAVDVSARASLRPLKQQRKQQRIQKQIERQGKNKLTTTEETPSSGQPESAEPSKHSLDGISNTEPREFLLRFFSKDEREMMIPGFGRPAALMIILRQLDLSEEQIKSIKATRQRVGRQLLILRQQHTFLENQLEDAIYGETFDPKRVEEFSVLVGGKQTEITKMQASVESDFRQILTADQFYVFRFLVGEMLLPQRRVQPRLLQQQRRAGQSQQNNRPPTP